MYNEDASDESAFATEVTESSRLFVWYWYSINKMAFSCWKENQSIMFSKTVLGKVYIDYSCCQSPPEVLLRKKQGGKKSIVFKDRKDH